MKPSAAASYSLEGLDVVVDSGVDRVKSKAVDDLPLTVGGDGEAEVPGRAGTP